MNITKKEVAGKVKVIRKGFTNYFYNIYTNFGEVIIKGYGESNGDCMLEVEFDDQLIKFKERINNKKGFVDFIQEILNNI